VTERLIEWYLSWFPLGQIKKMLIKQYATTLKWSLQVRHR